MEQTDLYMRYLGVLSLLGRLMPYIDDEEERDCIERAFNDAAENHPIKIIRAGRSLGLEPVSPA